MAHGIVLKVCIELQTYTIMNLNTDISDIKNRLTT